MSLDSLISKIGKADSLNELSRKGLLPEPNDDGSYFFVYYSRADFKQALKDIVTLSELGMRIWYDRKQEGGASWCEDMLARAGDFHCAAVVFYLSENALTSPFFWELCSLVAMRHVAYCSVNLPNADGSTFSFGNIANIPWLTHEQLALAEQLFGEEITYVPHSVSADEKKIALERIGKFDLLLYAVEEATATVLCVKDLAEEEIVIPPYATINGVEYPVRRIAPRAFANCTRLKKVIFPDSVEYVGEYLNDHSQTNNVGLVFLNCTALEELTMPSNLKVLRMNNFEGCVSLKRLYFADNVEQIVDAPHVFDELTELRLPSIVKRTQEGTFLYFDTTWKQLDIYNDEGHVYGCEDVVLDEIYTPAKGSAVGALYRHSTLLRQVDASNLDSETFDGTFWQCENLEKVTLPPNTRRLSANFYGCSNLTTVDLPDSLEEIGEYTFAECNFEQLVLPQNVHSIDQLAFNDATIGTLISDSKYNDKLFARSHQFNNLSSAFETAGKKHPILTAALVSPFMMLKVMFHGLFHGNLMMLLLILLFPITFWLVLFSGGATVLDKANISQLYLKRGTHHVRCKGFKRVKSDMQGYDCFVPKA